ncbi:MAG: sensor histidine kinase [Myxococcota bacterium]
MIRLPRLRRGPPRPWHFVLEAVLVWLGLGILMLYVYRLVEGTWFADLPDDKRELARLVRSVAISITATVATAVYVLWRAVPSLRRTLIDEAAAERTSTRERLAEWLVSLRWVALLVLAPIVVLSTTGGFVPPASALPLWVGVAALFLVNTLLVLLRRDLRATPHVFVAQVFLDTGVLAWLVHHAGGMANPFAGIFAFHAVIAGIVLAPRLAGAVIGAMTLFVAAVTMAEAGGLAVPACVTGFDGICRQPDALHVLASGLGVAILVAGCGLFVVALVGAVRRERDRLGAARQELAEEREKLRSIIDCMADAVVFSDSEGRIRLLNHAALHLWPEGPPESRNLRVCHNPESWQRMLDKLANPAKLESHPILEVGERAFEPNYARVMDDHGNLRGVVMVARDVTDRLEAQKWRMREERMAVVGKLAAALAHELNNPLGSIALFTQHALKKLPDDDPLREHLQTVLRNANLCSKHVRDLLAYARQRPPERGTLDPREILEQVMATLAPKAERSGVRVAVEVAPDAPARMVGDADQLRQVLVNLGLNGIEAMDRGGTLMLAVAPEGPADVRFEVADEGCGIPEDQRELVFSAFHTTKAEGTGLGLAVASDIVRAHGGRIEVRERTGGGTVFSVWLPLNQPQEREAAA